MKRYTSLSQILTENSFDTLIDVGSKIAQDSFGIDVDPSNAPATPVTTATTPAVATAVTNTRAGSAQNQLTSKYGPPSPQYLREHCQTWHVKQEFPWFVVESFLVNTDFKAMLHAAFTSIQAQNLQGEIKSFDGCYELRDTRGGGAVSLHSWAAAIDLNASIEPQGSQTTKWSSEFIKCMTDANIYWGGNFHTVKDPMHFAMFNG